MLDTNESLLPLLSKDKELNVVAIGFEEPSLEELGRLLDTLQIKVSEAVLVHVKRPNPATYIGSGKCAEIEALCESLDVGAVIVDTELSPNQLRNLERVLKKPTLDRGGVIIEIFSQHARTKEAKTQVELARVQYLLPRLTHFWSHFERQRGGIGLKGMGEKQLEVDRRLLKKKVGLLKKRLGAIERERQVQRSGRKDVLKVAIVGYTNAGKSTLLNALTHSRVLAEDKLFATLDSSVRALSPDSRPPIVAIDTVGFINKIPPTLVASFRSTLEELHEADLLVHVIDASSPQAREQYEVTEGVLDDLKLGSKPRLLVLNKADLVREDPALLSNAKIAVPGALLASALSSEDMKALREKIMEFFRANMEVWELMIPYAESKLESALHAHGNVEIKRHMEKGTFYRLRIDAQWAQKLELERFKL